MLRKNIFFRNDLREIHPHILPVEINLTEARRFHLSRSVGYRVTLLLIRRLDISLIFRVWPVCKIFPDFFFDPLISCMFAPLSRGFYEGHDSDIDARTQF